MKVLNVIGTRPQYIKLFPVCRELAGNGYENVIVDTGQHYDETLSQVFLEELDIPSVDYDLDVRSGSHGEQTGRMLAEIEDIVEEEDPDAVIVYGDTNSTLAAAIATAKLPPRLTHVESGTRSYNRSMPEELNRVMTDHVSDVLYAPTERAVENLAHEGLTDGVVLTGDVMYDAILWAREYVATSEDRGVLDDLPIEPGEFVLATVHRPRNTDDGQRLQAILSVLDEHPLPVVFPAHPRVRNRIAELDLDAELGADFHLIDPVGYLDFVRLLDGAERVATDSGGAQKEAFMLETPCVTLREETEWDETVECGWNRLVGADPDLIREALGENGNRPPRPDPFGDGRAAERIVGALDDGS
ncbi:non-hydrolyzing UDP-N-acetylglucosamine 2-epimerase [Halalkalicoccus jeotgali]|uniref:UDP-N-acetylglucosamine 2-epimerase n=1 Tax=Halalkalicoccus jeotgali (strain DSM 18796 / CECT 7217 / JCM 14584 / KCTC 4019 / B3) TaxID=795797 RepID=D8J465_HALJB|nr:UDP-N-acetylglucosamine 2-epimerase (non-hydrolyzing) [Halalkalicoccus jeotgali]ADJ15457.1 UDP-N-acetylglucosamine 2-epimerase [Halalkalicoccus jeotgali B3]ELY36134.1 UDP-N-acetylglucosamine 2-epimerase [Halalkalicoccus jeotgali B3]